MVRIQQVKVMDEYRLKLLFSDGVEKIIDIKPFIRQNTLTEALKDKAFFNRAKIYENGRGIYWPNDFDLCPDYLRYHAGKVEVVNDRKQI